MELSSGYLMSTSGLDLLNKIFLSAGEGIIIVNENGEIVMANKRSEELFGYNEAELLGHVIENLIPKEYHKRHVGYRKGYVHAPKSRPMGIGQDLVGLRKDGNTFPLEVSLSFINHQNQKLVVAFITDISTRKQQEAALAESRTKLVQYAQDLETKVGERTKELEHLNLGLKSQIRERKLAESALKESLEEVKKAETEILKALEKEKELNELKSRFISMASHEFRTPLTTIQSSADLIGRYPKGEDQEKRDKHINRIRNSVQNLTNILNDFLSLEKLESGSFALKIVPFSLKEIYEEVIEAMELALKSGQEIHSSFDEEVSAVVSDPHLIKNICLNLLSNAIKYSPEHSNITFSISKTDASEVLISVKDEGIGIPQKEQSNMFQRFFRAENATNIQGTGLGLNIVKRYLQLLQGEISFVSKEGLGTEFIVKFPFRKP